MHFNLHNYKKRCFFKKSGKSSKKQNILFFKGFCHNVDISEIRELLRDEIGGNLPSVEFFNVNDQKLFLALTFDNKHVTKVIMKKYHGKEILGNIVTIIEI